MSARASSTKVPPGAAARAPRCGRRPRRSRTARSFRRPRDWRPPPRSPRPGPQCGRRRRRVCVSSFEVCGHRHADAATIEDPLQHRVAVQRSPVRDSVDQAMPALVVAMAGKPVCRGCGEAGHPRRWEVRSRGHCGKKKGGCLARRRSGDHEATLLTSAKMHARQPDAPGLRRGAPRPGPPRSACRSVAAASYCNKSWSSSRINTPTIADPISPDSPDHPAAGAEHPQSRRGPRPGGTDLPMSAHSRRDGFGCRSTGLSGCRDPVRHEDRASRPIPGSLPRPPAQVDTHTRVVRPRPRQVLRQRSIRRRPDLTAAYQPGGASRRVRGRARSRGLLARSGRRRRSWQPIPAPPRVRAR